ncbi:MAG: hypothetical protein GF320_13180 [Armatimonadia bacterium]|nr:hypothetical protein [Armatimonadia bacterium]
MITRYRLLLACAVVASALTALGGCGSFSGRADELVLFPSSENMTVGDVLRLQWTLRDVQGQPMTVEDDDLRFESGDPAVATVTSDGRVTAVSEGEAAILATYLPRPTIDGRCMVYVSPR